MPQRRNIVDIVDQIYNGGVDDDLDEIMGACQDRRKEIGRQTIASLHEGDTVRIMGGPTVRPKYIIGATATVREIRVSKVTIEFPADMGGHDPYHKFAGKRWIFPATVLEKVQGG